MLELGEENDEEKDKYANKHVVTVEQLKDQEQGYMNAFCPLQVRCIAAMTCVWSMKNYASTCFSRWTLFLDTLRAKGGQGAPGQVGHASLLKRNSPIELDRFRNAHMEQIRCRILPAAKDARR